MPSLFYLSTFVLFQHANSCLIYIYISITRL
nr:MAG TPA: hypothetical protein [Caudoviricetes sp.]